MLWLQDRRTFVVTITVATIGLSFALDLIIPGYAIAGFYLFPLLLVVFALRDRLLTGLVSVTCLGLAVCVMLIQHRVNGQNIALLSFGALAVIGLIALGSLYNRFDDLYKRERSTTDRLQQLMLQLQQLQEISVLESDMPLSDLVDHIIGQAQQLLGSDGGVLFRLDDRAECLSLQAAVGIPYDGAKGLSLPLGAGPISQAVLERRPVAIGDLPAKAAEREGHLVSQNGHVGFGACLAVPLVARQNLYGAIALYYRQPRRFNDQDISIARSFGDQAALAIENARLREQLERSAVAAERSRLARDLHDSVTQSLFAASLKAEALHRRREMAPNEAQQGLDDLRRLTRGALAQMRTLLLEMRPAALAEAPLEDLLAHLVQAAEGRAHTSVKLTITGRLPPRPEVSVAFYRIAEEALNNIVRHAKARRAWVNLTSEPGHVKLVVRDNGRGFDTSCVRPDQLGLGIMRERAESVGARLAIESLPRHGTVITTEWFDEHR